VITAATAQTLRGRRVLTGTPNTRLLIAISLCCALLEQQMSKALVPELSIKYSGISSHFCKDWGVSARLNSRREAVLSFSRAYISDTASSTANAARASNWRASHLQASFVPQARCRDRPAASLVTLSNSCREPRLGLLIELPRQHADDAPSITIQLLRLIGSVDVL
jgi:hypothetical protein